MSYTYHGTTDLVALPNRTVQTYPSGLVRVEQSFVCRKSQAATYRSRLKAGEKMPISDSAPAIDGLYIFPDAAQAPRDDGFFEFRVTAYGRTSTTGQRVALSPARGYLKFYALYRAPNSSYDPTDSTSSATLESELESSIPVDIVNVYYKFCVPANQTFQPPDDIRQIGGIFLADTSIDLFSQSFSAAEIFPTYLTTNVRPSSQIRRSPVFSVSPTGFNRSNFGKFDEITVFYLLTAGRIHFGSFFDGGSTPSNLVINSIVPTFSGAIVSLIIPPFSSGLNVTVDGVTQYIPYDRSGSVRGGGQFTLNINRSGQNTSLTIGGLNDNTVYTARIAPVNENGAGADNSFSFKTKSFAPIGIS